jgi:Zn-finger nucleic acid-binding protein
MSESALERRRKALEESYFEKKNREALELLAKEVVKKEKLCPLTREPLKETVLYGVVVYACPETKGVWVEGPELERLFRGLDSSEAEEAGVKWDLAFFEELSNQAREDIPHGALKIAKEFQGERLSPATGEPMVKFEIDGIILDRCEQTGGIWFDANELDELLEKAKNPSEENVAMPEWIRSFFKAIGYK